MVLVVTALLGIILPQGALGACGYDGVFVSGTAEVMKVRLTCVKPNQI